MLAMKLISVLAAVIFSLSFVSYGIAAQGPGANSGKNLEAVEELDEEEIEELDEIDVEMPEELLMEELEHGIKL